MICPVCGNELETITSNCHYCGAAMEKAEAGRPSLFMHKIVNLEEGRPVVDIALKRLSEVIDVALLTQVTVITLIHGYGSSGKGGVIKTECRKTLESMKSRRHIRDYIAGEDFNKKTGRVKSLLHRYPQLASDKNLNKNNQGITLVILTWGALLITRLLPVSLINATFLS